MDYLFGITEVRSSDLSVADICEKTGLSEDTVVRLCEDHQANNEKDLFSLASWWSNLLSSEAYYSFPMAWRGYAQRIVQLYDIAHKRTDEADPAGNIKSDKEKSSEKIDCAIATIMALDRAIRCGGDSGESVYVLIW